MIKLVDILDKQKLEKHLVERNIGMQRHPTLPLRIYNYTQTAQFNNVWGDGTIDYCRGLIVDDNDNVVARPFKKFHNFNTEFVPETIESNLPKTTPVVTEKLDGSLGIFWRYGKDWGVATRGSFTSPQAEWATKFYLEGIKIGIFDLFNAHDYTPLFEIIFRENRIVCQYDWEGLVVLGFVNKISGSEMSVSDSRNLAALKGFRHVVNYQSKSLSECVKENESNREGYVISYPTGHMPPVKIKIKFEDYVRMHKLVTGVNPRVIWEFLSEGREIPGFDKAPEHFQIWAKQWVDKLTTEYDRIFQQAKEVFKNAPQPYQDNEYTDEDRKYRVECAEYFKHTPDIMGILFGMLDGKDVNKAIWRMIKPRGDDQTFKTDGE